MAIKNRRGYQAKLRNSGTRKRRSIILISAEGNNKTETRYFRDLARAYNLNIQFASGNYTDPVNMVNALKKEYYDIDLDSELGDKAFCLVDSDVDSGKNEQLAKADRISNSENIQLIVSSPCFEVWCLCHFMCKSTQYNSSSSVVEELIKILPWYKKSGEHLFEALSLNIAQAIQNAKTLEKRCTDAGYTPHTVEFSPSTEIYKVIEMILPKE